MTSAQRFTTVPFTAIGTACVVAGGLVAAITARTPTTHTTWTAAYLVLVAGVAQVGLGWGQALLAPRTPSPQQVWAQILAWNIGNLAVISGTLTERTPLVDLGGVLLVIGLALMVTSLRGGVVTGGRLLQWARYGYGALVLILLVSIPIGLMLARSQPN